MLCVEILFRMCHDSPWRWFGLHLKEWVLGQVAAVPSCCSRHFLTTIWVSRTVLGGRWGQLSRALAVWTHSVVTLEPRVDGQVLCSMEMDMSSMVRTILERHGSRLSTRTVAWHCGSPATTILPSFLAPASTTWVREEQLPDDSSPSVICSVVFFLAMALRTPLCSRQPKRHSGELTNQLPGATRTRLPRVGPASWLLAAVCTEPSLSPALNVSRAEQSITYSLN